MGTEFIFCPHDQKLAYLGTKKLKPEPGFSALAVSQSSGYIPGWLQLFLIATFPNISDPAQDGIFYT